MKKNKIYLLTGICGILAAVSIFLTIESAASGTEIVNLQKKEAALVSQQQDMQESLVENLSAGSLQEKSIKLGFTQVKNLVYVASTTDSVTVARLP